MEGWEGGDNKKGGGGREEKTDCVAQMAGANFFFLFFIVTDGTGQRNPGTALRPQVPLLDTWRLWRL